MRIGHGCQLRQMGHAQNLLAAGYLRQLFRHLLSRPAGNAGIHFIKYQRGNGFLLGQHIFQRQHDPGQLAAGSNFGDGPQILAHVGGHQEADGIAAILRRFLFRKINGKANLIHVQIPKLLLDPPFQNCGCFLPLFCQYRACRPDCRFRFLQPALQ